MFDYQAPLCRKEGALNDLMEKRGTMETMRIEENEKSMIGVTSDTSALDEAMCWSIKLDERGSGMVL